MSMLSFMSNTNATTKEDVAAMMYLWLFVTLGNHGVVQLFALLQGFKKTAVLILVKDTVS